MFLQKRLKEYKTPFFKNMILLGSLIFLFFSNPLLALTTNIKPNGTYLFVDYFHDKQTEKPTSISLEDIKAAKSDVLEIGFSSSNNQINKLLGVFTDEFGNFIPLEDEVLKSPISFKTKFSKLPTDIPFDFPVDSKKCTNIKIPSKAKNILFSMNDSFFSNNQNLSITTKINKLLFEIVDYEIYQVVPSPKIDLENNSKSFDLTKDKPAVMVLSYKKRENVFSDKVLEPTITINQKTYKPKCFDEIKKTPINCHFTLNDFNEKDILKQIVIFPMNQGEVLNKEGFFKISFGLKNDKNCFNDRLNTSLTLNIHKTRKLQIGFVLMEQALSFSTPFWKSFINDSLLDFNLLKKIFPVPDKGDNVPQWIFLNQSMKTKQSSKIEDSKRDAAFIESKDKIITLKESDTDQTKYILKDLMALKKLRIKQQLSKLFAVASKDYFKQINKENVGGFVIFTKSPATTENVGFIRIDQAGKGTILHELGHLLGQLKEFYQKSFKQLSVNDICKFHQKTDYCFRFNKFEGFHGSLKWKDYSNWSFVKKSVSIMGNSSNISQQWIDRDTYSKSLKTLTDPMQDPEIIIFSSLYSKQNFIEPELEYVAEGILTPSNPNGDLEIQILDNFSKILYSIEISTKVSIEFIDSFNKQSTTEELITYPIVVALPHLEKGKKIVIIKKDTKQRIYSKKLPAKNIIFTDKKIDLLDRIVFE